MQSGNNLKPDETSGLDINFEMMGFESTSLIENLGSTAEALLILILGALALQLLLLLGRNKPMYRSYVLILM